jgi:hypothetical protein
VVVILPDDYDPPARIQKDKEEHEDAEGRLLERHVRADWAQYAAPLQKKS